MTELQHLNWDEIEWEQVTPDFKRKLVTGDNITIARLSFKEGFIVPMHSHHNEQISTVISGKIQFWFGENRDIEKIYGPGDVVVIPAHLPHEAKMLTDFDGIDTWSPRREDWLNGSDDYLRQ